MAKRERQPGQFRNPPAWMKRALNSKTPTKNNQTVRTSSDEHKGKEILFPTIRMVNGKLKKFSREDAKKEAIRKRDYLTFDSPAEATRFSKKLSNLIGQSRKGV
jgi:hypothetical protein